MRLKIEANRCAFSLTLFELVPDNVIRTGRRENVLGPEAQVRYTERLTRKAELFRPVRSEKQNVAKVH